MGEIVRLVPAGVSDETVKAIEYLLQEARAGRYVGLAWVAMRAGYLYDVDIAGETRRAPTFTRGMLRVLDDELAQIVKRL